MPNEFRRAQAYYKGQVIVRKRAILRERLRRSAEQGEVAIMANPTEARYLKVGDLYSDRGPEFWQYVKVNAPLYVCVHVPEPDDKSEVWRLEVRKLKGNAPQMDPSKLPGL